MLESPRTEAAEPENHARAGSPRRLGRRLRSELGALVREARSWPSLLLTVGTALALKGSGRMTIGVCGDGDFMMANTAIWTAAHYKIPMLIVVANNRSFFNDELHQERVARIRSRPVENRWIGQRISEPDIDIAALARSQGAQGFGPVTKTGDLVATFEKAIAAVEAGNVVVVDVRVEPGYSAVTTAAMLRGTEKK